jgi:putative tryptophan/tyrosine transport system substrate-binding protein
MRRRNLIFGLLAVATMGRARAEQSAKVYRIAIVHPSYPVSALTDTSFSPGVRAIFTGLRRLGYIEGKNLLIERYSGEGQAAHYPDLARDVVAHNPDLIITTGDDLVLDLKATTTTIPIVGIFLAPIESGIVPSLARPSGNITGLTVQVGFEVWSKRIQLLRQVMPQLTRLGRIESRATSDRWEAVEREEAQTMGITWVGPTLNHPIDEAEYRREFAALVQDLCRCNRGRSGAGKPNES